MPSELLSHRLVTFRERHGLSQVEMAEMLSISTRYLIYLETGQKEADPNSSLYKLFDAYEVGQIPVNKIRGKTPGKNHSSSLREEPGHYDARHHKVAGGLNPQDVLSQIRADLAMIEGGAQAEKRRAYHFLYEVHLPMLAEMLQLK